MSIIRLKETNSTNVYAKSNMAELPDKTVIIADRQTSGRGRFDRVWIDLGGDNLFMSIVLKPDIKFANVYPNITQYLSVTICKVMESYGLSPEIKWPNDVLINGKKICGILSEAVTKNNMFKGLVLGAGINLNSDAASLSEVKDKAATALNIELSEEYVDKDEFTEKLLDEFFRFYDKFLKCGFNMIKDDYLKRACFLNNEISVQIFDEIKSGIASSVTDNGELILKNDNKDLVLTMGDIL